MAVHILKLLINYLVSGLCCPPAGTALAFATLFKLGQRSALLAPASQVFPHAVQLLGSHLAASNALARQASHGLACALICSCYWVATALSPMV